MHLPLTTSENSITPQFQRLWERVLAQGKSLGILVLVLIALPVSASIVLVSLLWSSLTNLSRQQVSVEQPQTILLTGGKMTKALQLARSFRAAGHRVVLVETEKYWLSGNQYSNSVDRFYTVPTPQKDPDGYAKALLGIVEREQVNLFIPVSSPVASVYDAMTKSVLEPHCKAFTFDADTTQMLDDKFTFTETARSLGLPAPKTFLITDPEQVLQFDFAADGSRYILKSIAYDSVHRLALLKLPCAMEEMAAYVRSLPIRKDNPWIMQEFLTGQEYCTHCVVQAGELVLYACSKSCDFLVNYEHDNNPQIRDWVTRFVKELNLTGQICLDFIQREDGTVFAIECNPRTSTCITMFHDQPAVVADAYLGDRLDMTQLPLQPLPGSKPTYWLFHELWRLTNVRSAGDLRERLRVIFQGTEAVFRVDDPLPFLGVNHWQIPLLILNSIRQGKAWERIDFNIGKLVQLGGD